MKFGMTRLILLVVRAVMIRVVFIAVALFVMICVIFALMLRVIVPFFLMLFMPFFGFQRRRRLDHTASSRCRQGK